MLPIINKVYFQKTTGQFDIYRTCGVNSKKNIMSQSNIIKIEVPKFKIQELFKPAPSKEQFQLLKELIPERQFITKALARSAPELQKLLKYQHKLQAHNTILSIYILIQKQKRQNSSLFHYINCLQPASNKFPLKYTNQQLLQLKGTSFIKYLQQNRSKIKSDFQILNKQFPKLKYEQFLQAYLIVTSRLFTIARKSKQMQVLIPIVDLLHQRKKPKTFGTFNEKKRVFQLCNVYNTKNVNDQIFITHGQIFSGKTLYKYGFILPNNQENNCIYLTFKGFESKMRILNVSLLMDTSNFGFWLMLGHFRHYIWLKQNKPYHNILQVQQFSGKDEHNKTTLQQLYQQYSLQVLCPQNQLQMWKLIKQTLLQKLNNYPTSVQEDKNLLKTPNLQTNKRNCIQIRLGQKTVLHYFIDLSKQAIKCLQGQNNNKLHYYDYYHDWLWDQRRKRYF